MSEKVRRREKAQANWKPRPLHPESVEASREGPHVAIRQHLWDLAVANQGTPRGVLYQDAWGFYAKADKAPNVRKKMSSIIVADMLQDSQPNVEVLERGLPELHPVRQFEVLAQIATTPHLQEAVSEDRWSQWWVRANINTPPVNEYTSGDSQLDLRMVARNNALLAIELSQAQTQELRRARADVARKRLERITAVGLESGVLSSRKINSISEPTLFAKDFDLTQERSTIVEQFDHICGQYGVWEAIRDPYLRTIYAVVQQGIDPISAGYLTHITAGWEKASPQDKHYKMADAMVLRLANLDADAIQTVSRSPSRSLFSTPSSERALSNILPAPLQVAIGVERHKMRQLDTFEQTIQHEPERAARELYFEYDQECGDYDSREYASTKALRIGLYLARASLEPSFPAFYPASETSGMVGERTDKFISWFNQEMKQYRHADVIPDSLIAEADAIRRNLVQYDSATSTTNLLKIVEMLTHHPVSMDLYQNSDAINNLMHSLVTNIDISWQSVRVRSSMAQAYEALEPVIDRNKDVAFVFSHGYSERWGYKVPDKLVRRFTTEEWFYSTF